MLKTRALDNFLRQVLDDGIWSVMLFNKEGLTVSATGRQSPLAGNVYSALLANIWDTFERPGGRENLREFTIGCDNGIVVVRPVASMLLAIIAETNVPIGMVKLKLEKLIEHLEESLSLFTSSNT